MKQLSKNYSRNFFSYAKNTDFFIYPAERKCLFSQRSLQIESFKFLNRNKILVFEISKANSAFFLFLFMDSLKKLISMNTKVKNTHFKNIYAMENLNFLKQI